MRVESDHTVKSDVNLSTPQGSSRSLPRCARRSFPITDFRITCTARCNKSGTDQNLLIPSPHVISGKLCTQSLLERQSPV